MSSSFAAAAGLLALAAPFEPPAPPADKATLSYVEGKVEVAPPGAAFAAAREGQRFPAGTRLRTGEGSLARVDFAFMTVLAGASAEIGLSADVPSLSLEQGRIEIASRGSEILELRAGDAAVRGDGWVVVRREGSAVQVTVIEGRFEASAQGQRLTLGAGQGAVLQPGGTPRAVTLGERARVVFPSADPSYVGPGESIDLSWSPPGKAHVQVLSFESDHVLVDRDAEGEKTRLGIPWPGLYRWRVAMRDPSGLEGLPSTEGLICVMEK